MNNKIKEYEDYILNERKIKMLSLEFETLGWDRKKEFLKFECNNTCQKCGNDEWMGEKIPLEVDHINGDNSNNVKDNLQVLCANCHGLTENWRGRNKTNKRNRISNSVLLESLIKHEWNMRQALLEVGLAAKGGNYKRCHAIKKELEESGLVNEINVYIEVEEEEFIYAFKNSDNVNDLVKNLGISKRRVYQLLKNYELDYRVGKIPLLSELLDNYQKLGNFVQLGKHYGVSDNGVRNWFIKYNVNPKTIIKKIMYYGNY